MRRGELFALHWPDVNFEAGTIAITKAIARGDHNQPVLKGPKTESGNRTLIITDDLVDILTDHREAMRAEGRDVVNGPVFVNQEGRYLAFQNFERLFWQRVTKKAGIRCGMHALRHTHASFLLHSGWTMHEVQHRLGHGSVLITMDTYGHLVPTSHEDMRSRLTSALPSLQPTVQPDVQPDATRSQPSKNPSKKAI